MSHTVHIQRLLSLPAGMAREFAHLENKQAPEWLATSDPAGRKIGSGGGTAHLLAEAWRATGGARTFPDWLRASRKLIVHGGGQSRRLPAYAPVGKILMPVPVFRWASGQRLDQSLLDIQLPDYERALAHAPSNIVAMVTSGDVLLRFGPLPAFPNADVFLLGMRVTPERARHHGVFFSPRKRPGELAFCLQKPSPEKIQELAGEYTDLVDTGMWLLSERAVQVLMERCGWKDNEAVFNAAGAGAYDLYAEFGGGLGANPTLKDPILNALTTAVVPLADAQFYHFGTTRQMIESVTSLQNAGPDNDNHGLLDGKRLPDQHVLNSHVGASLRPVEQHTLWIENSHVPVSWQLAHNHVLTGVPENQWSLKLRPGVCLDFIPIGNREFCIRPYGFDDSFSGALGLPATSWLGARAANWFKSRSLSDIVESHRDTDIQTVPLFPVLSPDDIDEEFLDWLVTERPHANSGFTERWRSLPRLSAEQISERANLERLFADRARRRHDSVPRLLENFRWSVMFKLDLAATAELANEGGLNLPQIEWRDSDLPMHAVHDQMFRSALLRSASDARWKDHEQNAFARLRDAIVSEAQLSPALPVCNVKEDQIVWARSPVRLDLAGGWTDTPPYCIEYGGRVLNLAVNLNGQPPIQVFARVCSEPVLVVRSIDLGVEQRIRTFDELDTFAHPGSEFALAKAAFALAGFLPRFHSTAAFSSLHEQLRQFGGGIELSMLSAVPKGSGLGTSSILAATLLEALSNLCGLNWDRTTLFTRTMALEQLLTTGGGWQDQAGAIFRGIKLIETQPGLAQKPSVRWLPEHLFSHQYANRSILLYYTGITRLAKNILHEIVRGMFLNAPSHLRIIDQIADNAERSFAALQECRYEAMVACVRRSWELNQQLDSGTNPIEVQRIIETSGPTLAAAKLLGAGGGGFLLLFAENEALADRIRERLLANPPNPRARFIDFAVSETGLQLTRS